MSLSASYDYYSVKCIKTINSEDDRILDLPVGKFKPAGCLGSTDTSHSAMSLMHVDVTITRFSSIEELNGEVVFNYESLDKSKLTTQKESEVMRLSVVQSKINITLFELPDIGEHALMYTPKATYATENIEYLIKPMMNILSKIKFKPRFIDINFNLFKSISSPTSIWKQLDADLELPVESNLAFSGSVGALYAVKSTESFTASGSLAEIKDSALKPQEVLLNVIRWRGLPSMDELSSLLDHKCVVRYNGYIIVPKACVKSTKIMFSGVNKITIPLNKENKYSKTFVKIKMTGYQKSKKWEVLPFVYEKEKIARGLQKKPKYKSTITDTTVSKTATSIRSQRKPAKLTVEFIDSYFRARHDMMHQAVCDCFGVPMTREKEFKETFDLTVHIPGSNRTPDIVISKVETEESIWDSFLNKLAGNFYYEDLDISTVTHLVMDVSVSSDTEASAINKLAIYSAICDRINETTNYNLLFLPMPFSDSNHEIPSNTVWSDWQLSILRDQAMLVVKYHQMIKKMKNYYVHAATVFTKESESISMDDFNTLISPQAVDSIKTTFEKMNLQVTEEEESEMDNFYMSDKDCEEYLAKYRSEILNLFNNIIEKGAGEDEFTDIMQHKFFKGATSDEIVEAVKEVTNSLYNEREVEGSDTVKIPKFHKEPRIVSSDSNNTITKDELLYTYIEYCDIHNYIESDPWENDVYMIKNMPRIEFEVSPEADNTIGLSLSSEAEDRAQSAIDEMFDVNIDYPDKYLEYKMEYLKNIEDEQQKIFTEKMFEYNITKIAFWKEQLAKEICYNCGRRFDEDVSAGCIRLVGPYILVMSSGKNFKRESQAFYKIIAPFNLLSGRVDTMHEYTPIKENSRWCETKWLAANYNDLEVNITLVGRLLTTWTHLFSSHISTTRMSMAAATDHKNFITESQKDILAIMMEAKRGTTRACQLNRYLHHGTMSYMSDKAGLVKNIGKEPIRSAMHARVVSKQLYYASTKLTDFANIQKSLIEEIHLNSSESGNDRHMIPAIFGDGSEMIELAEMMNENYAGNLFNYNAGFISHRSKEIMDKMAEDERKFRTDFKKSKSDYLGKIDDLKKFWAGENNYGKFDRKLAYVAGHFFNKKFMSNVDNSSLRNVFFENLTEIATLKRLVYETPVAHGDQEHGLNQESKDFAYCSIRDLIEQTGCSYVSELVNVIGACRMYFATFPKAQHGGPREIQMQSRLNRAFFRLSEEFWGYLCKLNPSEMMVRGDTKFFIQANMKFKMMSERGSQEWTYQLFAAKNKDNSHWSPAWNMMLTIYFIKGLRLPYNIEAFLINHCKAVLGKVIGLPPSLEKKWSEKPYDQTETYSENLAWLEQEYKKHGSALNFILGFVQGQNGKMSSVVHVAAWSLAELIMSRTTFDDQVEITQEAQISSDDSTEYFVFRYNEAKYMHRAVLFNHIVKWVVFIGVNMHENTKKSGFGFVMQEFNSCFMIGKRTLLPTIKDTFTACSVPDLTIPEDAVKIIISNEKRLMVSGAMLWTHTAARVYNRLFLLDVYCVDNMAKKTMLSHLGLEPEDEDLLPVHAGCLPVRDIYESLICGADYYMHKANSLNSLTESKNKYNTLIKFYKNIYSADIDNIDQSLRTPMSSDSEVFGKVYAKLPTRTDSMLTNLKSRYSVNVDAEVSRAEDDFHHLLGTMTNAEDCSLKLNQNLLVSGTFYEFRDSVFVNSLVRALSAAGRGVRIYGTSKIDVEYNQHSLTDFVWFMSYWTPKPISLDHLPNAMICNKMFAWTISKKPNRSTCNLDIEVYAHHKYRRVTFSTMMLTSKLSAYDIYKYMCGDEAFSHSRMRSKINSLSMHTGINFDRNYDAVAYELFHFSKTPRLMLWNYITSYLKITTYNSVDMAFEKPDSGSITSNLSTMYAYRMDPRGVVRLYNTVAVVENDEIQSIENMLTLTTNFNTLKTLSSYISPEICAVETTMTSETHTKHIMLNTMVNIINGSDSNQIWQSMSLCPRYSLVKKFYKEKTAHIAGAGSDFLALIDEGLGTRSEIYFSKDPSKEAYLMLKEVLQLEYRTNKIVTSDLGHVTNLDGVNVSVYRLMLRSNISTRMWLSTKRNFCKLIVEVSLTRHFKPINFAIFKTVLKPKPVKNKRVISIPSFEHNIALRALMDPTVIDNNMILSVLAQKMESQTFDAIKSLIYTPNKDLNLKEVAELYTCEIEILKNAINDMPEEESFMYTNKLESLMSADMAFKEASGGLSESDPRYWKIQQSMMSGFISDFISVQNTNPNQFISDDTIYVSDERKEAEPESLRVNSENFPELGRTEPTRTTSKPTEANMSNMSLDLSMYESSPTTMLESFLGNVSSMLTGATADAIEEVEIECDVDHSIRSLLARVSSSFKQKYKVNTSNIYNLYNEIHQKTNDNVKTMVLLFHTLVCEVSYSIMKTENDPDTVAQETTLIVLMCLQWIAPKHHLEAIWQEMEIKNVYFNAVHDHGWTILENKMVRKTAMF